MPPCSLAIGNHESCASASALVVETGFAAASSMIIRIADQFCQLEYSSQAGSGHRRFSSRTNSGPIAPNLVTRWLATRLSHNIKPLTVSNRRKDRGTADAD